MEKDIIGNELDNTAVGRKLQDFMMNATPEKVDVSSIKKATYAKIHRSSRKARRKRIALTAIAAAASLLLLFSVTAVFWHSPKNGKAVQMVSTTVPVGQRMTIMLADGTKVIANSRTTLSYPRTFDGSTREVTVRGEACFDVAHDKSHPFIVHASGFDVRVLGTKFNVSCYNASRASVFLERGSVELTTASHDKVTMRPGQMTAISDGLMTNLSEVNAQSQTSWTNGVLNLQGEKLSVIVTRINDYYGTDIALSSPLPRGRFYGKLALQPNVDDVVASLNAMAGTHTTVKGGKVYLSW